ncbi:C25 family cysteine peptidase [Candidatus Omnitrophota bacterium]
MKYRVTIIILIALLAAVPFCFAKANPEEQRDRFVFDVSMPELSSKEIQATDGNSYRAYSIGEYHYTTEKGKPMLPIKSFTVAVPPGAQDITVAIAAETEREERLSQPLLPIPKQVAKKDGEVSYFIEEFAIDKDFYINHQEFYPNKKAAIAERANLRGLHYVRIDFFPIQYRPADQTLRINEETTLEVSWNVCAKTNPGYIGPSFQNFTKNILNYESTEIVPRAQSAKGKRLSGDEPIKEQLPQRKDGSTAYLIIVADAFHFDSTDALSPFINQKLEMGFDVVQVEKLDTVYYMADHDLIPEYPELQDIEDDSDLKIKRYIKKQYEDFQASPYTLEHVLLIGDANSDTDTFLPTHKTIINPGVESDYWYSCINDDDGDGIVDDGDTIADLIIGRFDVQTEDQLNYVIDKTIDYEVNPPVFPHDEWGSKALLATGLANPDQLNHHLRDTAPDYIIEYPQEANEVYAHLYEDNQESYRQAKDDIISFVNDGHLFFIMNAHGGNHRWRIGNIEFADFMQGEIETKLTNEHKLPILFSLSCLTGSFQATGDSLMAAFVNAEKKGAVASIGASDEVYQSDSMVLLEGILQAVYKNENYTIGSSLIEGKLNTPLTIVRHLYNLFGDPSLDFSAALAQSEKPDLTCSIDSGEYSFDEDDNLIIQATIFNSKDIPLENAIVALRSTDGFEASEELISTTITADPGITSLDIMLENLLSFDGDKHHLVVDWPQAPGDIREHDELSEYNNIDSRNVYFDCQLLEPLPTVYMGNGSHPRIHKNKIVWLDKRFTGEPLMPPLWNIYMYDLGPDELFNTHDDSEEIQIATNVSEEGRPVIYENIIVWENNGIWLYDLGPDGAYGTGDDSGEILLTPEGSKPAIHNAKIVWVVNEDPIWSVLLYDIGPDGYFGTSDDIPQETVMTYEDSAGLDQKHEVAIFKNKICLLFISIRSGGFGALYALNTVTLYDLGDNGLPDMLDDDGPHTISSANTFFLWPAHSLQIEDNVIYWAVPKSHLHYYDLGSDGLFGDDTEGTLPINAGAFTVDANTLSCEFKENILTHDTGLDGIFNTTDDREWQTESQAPQKYPDIHRNKVVYHADFGHKKVYLMYLPTIDPPELHEHLF